MKYEKLKNQTNLHWYNLKDGRKLQRFQISEMIYALFDGGKELTIQDVAENVGIEHKISTYWARHTYATILKRAGVSSSFIGDSLGHSSPDITDKYLGSFEDEQRESNVANLTDWD